LHSAFLGDRYGPPSNPNANSGADPYTLTVSDAHAESGRMSFSDAALTFGVVAALIGVLARNVTAAALLCSFVFSTMLCRLGVEFNFVLWVAIDLAVILCIIHPKMRKRDIVVLALFMPIWVIYLCVPRWGAQAVDLLIALQMLLTFPAWRTLRASKAWFLRIRNEPQEMEFAAA